MLTVRGSEGQLELKSLIKKTGISNFLMPSFIKLKVSLKLNYVKGGMIVPC